VKAANGADIQATRAVAGTMSVAVSGGAADHFPSEINLAA